MHPCWPFVDKIGHPWNTDREMSKMCFMDSKICTYSQEDTLDYYIHAIWYCTPIKHFWQQVTSQLSLLLKLSIPLSSSLCLLRDTPEMKITQRSSWVSLTTWTVAKKNYPEKVEISSGGSLVKASANDCLQVFRWTFSHTAEFLTQFGPQLN